MHTDPDLQQRIEEGESDRVEFKPSAAQNTAIRRAICAFANDLAGHDDFGVLVIGLDDAGRCRGVDDIDRTQRKVADWAFGGDILPKPDVEISAPVLAGCQVVLIKVRPSRDPPVRYQGQVWVRVGTTNRGATPEQEQRLTERRRGHLRPFDLRPIEGATLSELDLEYFHSHYLPHAVAAPVLAANERGYEHQLAALRLLSDGQPNHGALLILGTEPRIRIPGAYLQFLRIDGTELGDPIKDQKELTGRLPQLASQIDDLLQLNVQTAVGLLGPTETQRADYPIEALRQLVRNAIIHRSYEGTNAPVRLYWFRDRVEISNPGGLYGQVTAKNFGQGATDYRNPLVAEAMHVLGYVQRFGYGVPLAKRALAENGNPPPEFDFEPTQVAVTVRCAE